MDVAKSQSARKRVIHTSFIVKDIYESIQGFLDLYGVGPWFVFEHYPMKDMKYRGSPAALDFTVAVAYSGPMALELIQQNDDGPSAYRDVVNERGYGFHHFAIASYDFDSDLARCRNLGLAVVNEGASPADHGGGRGAYVDTSGKLPGMTELMEIVPELASALTEMEATAANWDGTDPIRVQKFGGERN
jgi:hypothetical protein